ncbi:MAG TPA: hypothetical protein VGO61_11945 [Steroidobacteraceae bacterium]|jgi:hypothetical protein|nr:hypothetical protein [Steroidobacteraceae bacterium]
MHDKLRIFRAALSLGACALLFHPAPAYCATESIEFVGEHLAEIPMDNRYAALPLWAPWKADAPPSWQMTAQTGYAQTHTGSLAADGLMVSLAAGRRIAPDWQLTGLVFFDDFNLSSGVDRRPLEVTFARGVPLSLPAPAGFNGLAGSARNFGLGLAVRRTATFRLWHTYEWTAGVLWQRVALRDYAFDFQILDGPSSGATGVLDYSADYSHLTPFLGIAWPREFGNWGVTPHAQAAVPLPRRGVVGRITGAGYDLSGDTGSASNDKPFGDPSLTLGLDINYRPWNLTVDLGSAISQALLEPLIHEGVDRNWMISLSWSY